MIVYEIKNLINNKRYIGSTVDFTRRKAEHINVLKKNKHHSKHLQLAWNKYGESSFEFGILEYIDDLDFLRAKEKEFILQFKTLQRAYGYNISESTTNFSVSGEKHPMYGKKFSEIGRINYWKGKKMPEEIKVKMRKPKSNTSNMVLNHADVRGEKNPRFGARLSEEQKNKISQKMMGKMKGDKNPMFGRTRAGEYAGHFKKVMQFDLRGNLIKEFINITEASKESKAIRQHISKCCKGFRNATGGYMWKYKEVDEGDGKKELEEPEE
jgi:group I intron endonuclease